MSTILGVVEAFVLAAVLTAVHSLASVLLQF
jgi:hypothetical protein